MTFRRFSVVILSALLAILGCGKKLPDAYGVYADTNSGQIVLPGQATRVAGTLLSPMPGLDGPSGPECSSLNDLIVFQKDVPPDAFGIVKLQFAGSTDVPSIFGAPVHTRINLWMPKERVEFDVKPVDKHPDMYVVSPRTPLTKGFYALYIGSFGGDMGMGARVYDIVVGSVSDFPSAANAAKAREDEVKQTAGMLLTKLNHMLNQRDYQHLEDVYKPDGKILSGTDLQNFATGNQTWLASAGNILTSEVTAVSLLDDNSAKVSVRTTYAKSGVQEESVILRRFNDRYFVTELK